ncbi:hypothetical protein FRC08_002531 [Ceratobasidium sp. 394]|nr:hypothetical protein FRC08_002531 [Ceratobasidium sp. 394]
MRDILEVICSSSAHDDLRVGCAMRWSAIGHRGIESVRYTYLMGNKNGTIVPLIIASDETAMCQGAPSVSVYWKYQQEHSTQAHETADDNDWVPTGLDTFDSVQDTRLNDATCRQYHRELLYRSLAEIFTPLKAAPEDGMLAWCADGYLRHVYPLITAWVADWPEQNDVACTTHGGCLKCTQKWQSQGQGGPMVLLRDQDGMLKAHQTYQRTKKGVGPAAPEACLTLIWGEQ